MMMSISSAVNWWEEWQLRILVLGSLFIQLYLAIYAPYRKVPSLHKFYRFLIWLSYLGGDALAIYALATLFNRQKKLQCRSSYVGAGSSHDLQVLWAPILLIHLGGRMTISAYNIEDNELWLRHVGVAVSQVTVTVYVFITSWSPSADKRLLAAAILLFGLGVLRCFEKPVALRRASFNKLVASFHPAPWSDITNREVVLEKYIQEAADFVQRNQDPPTTLDVAEKQNHFLRLSKHDMLFVDFAYAYDDRFEKLKSLWLLDFETGLGALRRGLSNTFNIIYTRIWHLRDENRDTDYLGNFFSILLWTITTTFPIASIVLFHTSHKQGYRGSDIKVTYLLLYITYFSEILSAPGRLFPYVWTSQLLIWFAGLLCPRKPVMVAQHSLIGGFLAHKKCSILFHIGKCFNCQDFLRQHIGQWHLPEGKGITRMVHSHVKAGWMFYIRDVESYCEFNDFRGHLALKQNGCEENLGWSIEKPFDESIIIWHVATDFCIHRKVNSVDSKSAASMPRNISNYMIYLLSAKPEMLLPGSRITLFNSACKEISDILEDDGGVSPLDKKQVTQKIMNKAEKSEVGFLHEAWLLAEALMQLGDDDKMWKVIRGVWVEMLCFSAGRCRGYLHAKSLCTGGEYLTFVSLLMSQAGLEVFPDKQQRVKLRLPKEQRLSIAKQMIEEANQPPAMVLVFGEENAATQPSSASQVVVVSQV